MRLKLTSAIISRSRLPYESYAHQPAAFCRDVLGWEPWTQQADALNQLSVYDRVAIKSGHKVGKSRLAAGAALWWYSTRRNARVILTSAVGRQVKHILWREVVAQCRAARQPIGADPAIDPNTGLRAPDGREILGFTTDQPESMAGFSGDEILFVIDEASGFDQSTYEAVQGNMAGGGKVLLIGNPTRTVGFFFSIFRNRTPGWFTYTISSRQTPNVTGIGTPVPGLANQEYIDQMDLEYGASSPIVKVRVDGEFSETADNAVMGIGTIEAARERWDIANATGALEIGVDVARFGDDDSVIQAVRGKHAYEPVSIHGADTVDVAGHVARLVEGLRRPGEAMPIVRVDVIGYGAGVVDVLARRTDMQVVGVNVGESARDRDKFVGLRDELWWSAREWLDDGGTLPPDPRLEAELLAPRYSFDARGRIKIEGKSEIKKRISRSPDRADALCLAVCGVAAMESAGITTGAFSEADALGRMF